MPLVTVAYLFWKYVKESVAITDENFAIMTVNYMV